MGFYVMRDKKWEAGPFDSENDAFAQLLRMQGQSVYYATTHEGWAIEEIDEHGLIGKRVRVHGGFEDGYEGTVIGNEPDRTRDNPYHSDRPLRFRVQLDDSEQSIGGFHPANLEVIDA